MNLVIISVLIGQLTVTSYRSVSNQTDSSPYHTSTGQHVYSGGCAISRDLLCGACRKLHDRCKHPEYDKKVHYGDPLYVDRIGFFMVNDVMGQYKTVVVKTKTGDRKIRMTQKMWVDLWVPSYTKEHQFHKSFGVNGHSVWKLKRTIN